MLLHVIVNETYSETQVFDTVCRFIFYSIYTVVFFFPNFLSLPDTYSNILSTVCGKIHFSNFDLLVSLHCMALLSWIKILATYSSKDIFCENLEPK